ncbi:MAG: glycerophosphodiester phosphodiesterase [Deltaproteobacteria bacterium]|nr:glycerophosphodiester phosphodiesterase [Deltaproteobacteria bacterium]
MMGHVMARWAWLGLLSAACSTSSSSVEGPAGDAGPEAPRSCEPGDPPLTCARYLNIAHRGGAGLRPENTMEAFEHAVSLGVDVLELDVRASSDGVLVVIHDDEVDRTTEGSGQVSSFTLAALQALDAGYDFTTDSGASHPYRGAGVVIPTLELVLDSFGDQLILLEIKQTDPPIVDDVLAMLDATGVKERVMVGSIYDEVVQEVRTKRHDVLTSMSAGEVAGFIGLYPENEPGYAPPAPALQPPETLVDAELMATADRLGVALHTWTVDDAARMTELLELHVHGIITDDPALLQQVQEKLQLPPK